MKLTLQFLIIALALSCATAPPDHNTARQIQSASGLATAIDFHSDALPLNAAKASNTLTLSEAIEGALRQSAELQIALAEVRVAQAEAHQSRLLPNPVLDIALRFPEGGGSTIVETSVSADLVKVLQMPRRISASDAALRAASARAVTIALDAIAKTQRGYFTVHALRSEVELITQRTSHLTELLAIAQARLKAGEITQLDVTTLKAEQAVAAIDLRDRKLQLDLEELALARLLGQPGGTTDWSLATPLPAIPTTGDESGNITRALRTRPEIQAERWQLASLKDHRALARLAWLKGAAAGLDAERDSDWSLGPSVDVPLPLFDWGQAQRAKARAQAIAARHRLTKTLRQIVQEVRQAQVSLAQLGVIVRQAREELVPLQTERVRLARAVYEAGQSDITPMRLAELDLLEARRKLLQLELRTALASTQLERSMGGAKENQKPNANR
ncbi:MAG: TolC family protein [Verrucomicrobiota bacterium]|nr:TolC family protein [Verrucomicrobiota bacterium]|tara:strand:+ start:97 stop:1431 length:1335 start_codon:yes stop_codon:yes gene_type:complete